jgi:hypothetical protein
MGGCTVGVIHVPGGIMFFKNRDLEHKYLVNRITAWQSTPEVHALKGANLQTGALEGIAVGVNRHGVCVANTHVVSTPGVTYDVLCERLVHEVQAKEDVVRIVEDFMARHTVQGGRILVASPAWAFLIEVLGERFEAEEIEGDFVITNSFSLIPHQEKEAGDEKGAERRETRGRSSANRLQVASGMIESISNVGELKSMLRSHVPGKGELSICNHRQDGGGTESSHIIQVRGDAITWSSLIGFPCEGDYHAVSLFG